MERSRKLDTIADNLDEMSVTLEEIKEDVKTAAAFDAAKLDKVRAEMQRAAEMIEEYIDPENPDK